MQDVKAPSKWITDLSADTPVADAARRVLTIRLETVRDCLGAALREDEQLVDRIHELRVATRRASAAFEVFAECLPPKVYKTARRRLRDLRRAAGEARDWDVMIGRLLKVVKERSPDDRAGADMLVGYAMAQRIPAQTRLEECSPNYPFDFERFMTTTIGAIRYEKSVGKNTLGTFVRPQLAAMLEALNLTTNSERRDDYTQLHEIRIAGKKLRYAMELFVDCFGPMVRKQICPALAKLQSVLGDVNDSLTAVERFGLIDRKLQTCLPNFHQRYRGELTRLIKGHEAELPLGRQRFHEWKNLWHQPEVQMAIADICYASAPLRHPLCHDAAGETHAAERIA